LRVLLAHNVVSLNPLYNVVATADRYGSNKLRAFETFFAAYRQGRNDGRAVWAAFAALRDEIGKGGSPDRFMHDMLRHGVIEPGADPIDPATADDDIPPPPPPTDEDDIPPPPPPLDEDDIASGTGGSDIDPEDLPPPPPYGDVQDYPAHMNAIRKVRGDKKLLARALQLLKDAMVANNDCDPAVPLNRLATEVATVLRNEPDPFPEPERETDPFPTRDPFPDDETLVDDPFPDTGPVGVDLNGLDDEVLRGGGGLDDDDGEDDNDPFPGRPGDDRRRTRAAGARQDDNRSEPGHDGRSGPGGDTAPQRNGAPSNAGDMKAFLKAAVAKIAAKISSGDIDGAKVSAGQASKMLAKLGGSGAAVPARDILSAAHKQAKTNKGGGLDDPSAGVKVGGIELKNDHANKADWATFGKQYSLDEESLQSCRQIGVAIVKTGADSPKAMTSAKKVAEKISKDKKAKFKFKNHRHLVASILQLVQFKATKQKLTKPLKASNVADILTEQEDA
ncbi:MAG: hypothetical protein AB3N17_16860, partial [Tateyamaria sp.]